MCIYAYCLCVFVYALLGLRAQTHQCSLNLAGLDEWSYDNLVTVRPPDSATANKMQVLNSSSKVLR